RSTSAGRTITRPTDGFTIVEDNVPRWTRKRACGFYRVFTSLQQPPAAPTRVRSFSRFTGTLRRFHRPSAGVTPHDPVSFDVLLTPTEPRLWPEDRAVCALTASPN